MTKCIYVSKNENIVSKNADTSTKIDLFLGLFICQCIYEEKHPFSKV